MDGMSRAPDSQSQPGDLDGLPSGGTLSQHDAASCLKVSVSKVGWLVFRGHLVGDRHHVTAASVKAEMQWRANASVSQRIKRMLSDALKAVTDGL